MSDINSKLNDNYAEPRPHTKGVNQKLGQLQKEFRLLQESSLELSNKSLQISLLLTDAQNIYKSVEQLTTNKSSINEDNVINCYKIFMKLYTQLRYDNDPEIKLILNKFTPFYHYVLAKYSNIIREQKLPI